MSNSESKILEILSRQLGISKENISAAIKLLDEGNTIPFIARYRKEATGSMSDDALRALYDSLTYLRGLEERRDEIIRLIDAQDKLTEEIRTNIENAQSLSELEDIYRPYRPKRRTRASAAKEKGLEPLAELIFAQNRTDNIEISALEYINTEKGVETADAAICGAMDIIAENISDNAQFRKKIRSLTFDHGFIVSKAAEDKEEKYILYHDFTHPLKKLANHQLLAINRGEKTGSLSVKIEVDEDIILSYLYRQTTPKNPSPATEYVMRAVQDGYKRLIAPSIATEIRNEMTENAETASLKVFGQNLSGLLLQPPIKGMVVMGFDPGYRTGCKTAVVDETGKVLDTDVIYCTLPNHDKSLAEKKLTSLIEKHGVNIISIGNGTASKESEIFISSLIKKLSRPVKYIMTNEAGASVYSASKLAAEEFPQYDVSLRSAVSIARRIQDPLAELVKIDPKSIGVGQYQHDMNQKRLGEALGGVVESCVNNVGVELNTASASLLEYVSGINKTVAKNILEYREEHGKFSSRRELLKVNKLGKKAFEQCAGFLRISGADNILDNTSVHPESYDAAAKLLDILGYSSDDLKNSNISDIRERIAANDKKELCSKLNIGLPTLDDITDSLLKPGRDPREDLPRPELRCDILSIEDLKPGTELSGTVRNVIDFGAFVDIGVHQDGLVHISQISDTKFIRHPSKVLSVGDVIKVRVLETDVKKNRISLTMKGVN